MNHIHFVWLSRGPLELNTLQNKSTAEEIMLSAQASRNKEARVIRSRHLVANCKAICSDADINFELDILPVECIKEFYGVATPRNMVNHAKRLKNSIDHVPVIFIHKKSNLTTKSLPCSMIQL